MIKASTRVVGLIAHPVAHSVSPIFQNYIYKKMDIDAVYTAYDVEHENVGAAVNGMKALGFAGFNITIPYKQTVIPFLDELDPLAKAIGAVNTVDIRKGRLKGYNTDGRGFIISMLSEGINPEGKKILLLGAGGTTRSIGLTLTEYNPQSITILNRTVEKAEILQRIINDYHGISICQTINEYKPEYDIIINTTSLGMWPNINNNPLEGCILNSEMIVCDVVFKPEITQLLKMAQNNGCKTLVGIDMLVIQGILASEIWFNKKINLDILKELKTLLSNYIK